MPAPWKALVVDDEPLGRKAVRDILSGWSDIELAAEADDGNAAAAAILEHEPDVIFLDIGMPGRSGMDVVLHTPEVRRPAVIFVTAHEEYALDALAAGAVDYVLKPFSSERLRQAAEKAIAWMVRREGDAQQGPFLEWLLGRNGKRTIPLRVDQVVTLRGSGNYVEFEAGGQTCLLRDTISRIESCLDPKHFCRIHRSVIVRLGAITAMESGAGGELLVTLVDGSTQRVGRTYREAFEQRFRSQ